MPNTDAPMPLLVLRELVRSAVARILLAFALTVFALAGVVSFLGVLDRIREPYIVSASRLLTPDPVEGSTIDVEYDVDRRRLCSTDLVSFFAEVPGDFVVSRKREPGGTTDLGQHTIRNRIELPAVLKAGKCYRHDVRVLSECTSSTQFNWPAPPVQFCVRPSEN